jgi:hypothetical protein
MSGSGAVNRWGRCEMCTDVAAKWRVGAVLEHRRCRRGDVRMEGVVMGCREPEPRGSGAVAGDWRGLVWCTSVVPVGISGWPGLLVVGWRAAALSRSCHKWRETWWDAGRCAETISARRWEGRDGLGRVNMASR